MARTSRNHAGVIRSNLKRTRSARRARARAYSKRYAPKPGYWSTGNFLKAPSVWKKASRRVVNPGYSKPRGLKASRYYPTSKPKVKYVKSKIMKRRKRY